MHVLTSLLFHHLATDLTNKGLFGILCAPQPVSFSEQIDQYLSNHIIIGEVAPGCRLPAAELAKKADVHTHPLHEAFWLLEIHYLETRQAGAIEDLVGMVGDLGKHFAHDQHRAQCAYGGNQWQMAQRALARQTAT